LMLLNRSLDCTPLIKVLQTGLPVDNRPPRTTLLHRDTQAVGMGKMVMKKHDHAPVCCLSGCSLQLQRQLCSYAAGWTDTMALAVGCDSPRKPDSSMQQSTSATDLAHLPIKLAQACQHRPLAGCLTHGCPSIRQPKRLRHLHTNTTTE
jgi:hypothetical protein